MIRQDRKWALRWKILALVVAFTIGTATLTDAQEKRTVAEIQADIDKLQVELREAMVAEGSHAEALWDLTLEEAVQMGLRNSTRPLEANTQAYWNLRSDVEKAYWNLSYAYHRLESTRSGRDAAYQTWKQTKTYQEIGDRRGMAQHLTQAEQNYFAARQQMERAQNNLFRAEAVLRYIVGLASTDNRLIRPIDNPTTEPMKLDWHGTLLEAFSLSSELRKQKREVEQREHELTTFSGQQEQAAVRNAQLQLARAKAILREQELELTRQLADSYRDISLTHQQMRTALAAYRVSSEEVQAVRTAYEQNTTTLDQLLQAQRRQSESNTMYYSSVIDYNLAISSLHRRIMPD